MPVVERERFLATIARAARSGEGGVSVATAEEALPLDNESLAIAEASGDRSAEFHAGKQTKKKRKR